MTDPSVIDRGFNYSVLPTVPPDSYAAKAIGSDGILLVKAVGSSGNIIPSRYSSDADATDGSMAIAASQLLQVTGYNSSAATRFFVLFNAVALPPNGTIPFWTAAQVPPGTNFSLVFERPGFPFGTGIHWASSTTRTTLTLTGAADMYVSALLDP